MKISYSATVYTSGTKRIALETKFRFYT